MSLKIKTIFKIYACTLILIFFNQLQSTIIFGSKYSTIQVDSWAACIIEHPLQIEQGLVNLQENGIVVGAPIFFNNGTIIDNGDKLKLTGMVDLDNDSVVLTGNCSFYGRNGTSYQPTFVSGKNNLVAGSLTICSDITLQDSNTTLSINLLTTMNGNIYLNGGMLCLIQNNINFRDGSRIVGPGTICETGCKMIYGSDPLTFSEDLYYIDAEDVCLNSNETLQGTWTFSGNATVDGHLNSLYLTGSGSILVERGSSLLIKNMTIHGAQGGNISCKDNAGTITFQNVSMYLEDDYSFSIGRFEILDQVTIFGSSQFIYQSQMESTILSRSTLTLDSGITFSYDPGCARNDLIVFDDPYSTLELAGATLHATLPGMQLTKGNLLVSHSSYLSSEQSGNLDNGITFGDDSPQDDLYCEIEKGTTLNVIAGSLKYRNALTSSWIMGDTLAALLIGNGSSFYLYENLNLGIGQITLSGGKFYYILGKNITGSTNVGGTINYVEL